MANNNSNDNICSEESSPTEILPPKNVQKNTDKEHAENERKRQRLELIKLVIVLCFVALGVIAVFLFLDLFGSVKYFY
jgi:hypothetical protein